MTPPPVNAVDPVRPARAVPQWWRDASGGLFWILLLALTGLWVLGGGVTELDGAAGWLNSTGRLTGLIASALLLIQVFLMARVPFFEKAWGQDELARTHRIVGFTSFNLMIAHIVLITLGYAAGSATGVWGTIVDLVLNYPGMLLAVAGTVALIMVVVTSVKKARRKLRYESWHLIHLYGYLGAGLALPHQLWTGADFLSSTAATVFWWSLYAVCAGAVLVFRIWVPLYRSLRFPLYVSEVREEGNSTTSVTVRGRGVAKLRAQGGQFFQWRFLDGRGWSRANPYSLSAAPTATSLRFTAARVGDGSQRLATLKPGTRVLVEGPYGRMHAGTRTQRKALLIGAGIGITPIRALLESLPQRPGDITVAHRVSDRSQLVLSEEIAQLAAARGARYVVIEGHRIRHRKSWLPESSRRVADDAALRQLCPDIADRDVFICGAPDWMDAVSAAARKAGVPADHIHLERFDY